MNLTQSSYKVYSPGDLLTWSWTGHNDQNGEMEADKRYILVIKDCGNDELLVLMANGKLKVLNSLLRPYFVIFSKIP